MAQRDFVGKLRLGVNIDHVATVRNARGGDVPDGAVGPFVSTLPLPVPDPRAQQEAEADFARILNALPDHDRFDIHAATLEFETAFEAAGAVAGQLAYTRHETLPEEMPANAAYDVALHVETAPEHPRFRLVFDGDVLTADEQAQLVRDFAARLSGAVGDRAAAGAAE